MDGEKVSRQRITRREKKEKEVEETKKEKQNKEDKRKKIRVEKGMEMERNSREK